jgi:hypothetical protein
MDWDRVGRRWCIRGAAALVAAIVLCASGLAPGQPRAAPAPPAGMLELRNLMTPSEFQGAGLDKLSPRELAALDGWVGRLMARLLRDRKATGCSSPVDTRIDGEFQGWSGHTVVGLENGQIWRQIGSHAAHAYKVSPRVQIHRSPAGCLMKVDGMPGEILVERLR